MQNIDIHCAVRVGQGESISVECKVFSTVLIHHAPQRGDSLNVFIAKTVRQKGELHPAGPNKGSGQYRNKSKRKKEGEKSRVIHGLSVPPTTRLPANSHHLSDDFSMSHFMLSYVPALRLSKCTKWSFSHCALLLICTGTHCDAVRRRCNEGGLCKSQVTYSICSIRCEYE